MKIDANDIVRGLAEAWCDRRQFGPLALVLPAWTSNNGMTDGWASLQDALKHAYVTCTDLPSEERDALKRAYVAIDVALLNR